PVGIEQPQGAPAALDVAGGAEPESLDRHLPAARPRELLDHAIPAASQGNLTNHEAQLAQVAEIDQIIELQTVRERRLPGKGGQGVAQGLTEEPGVDATVGCPAADALAWSREHPRADQSLDQDAVLSDVAASAQAGAMPGRGFAHRAGLLVARALDAPQPGEE